jgi:hypothetical protein
MSTTSFIKFVHMNSEAAAEKEKINGHKRILRDNKINMK